MKNTTQWAVVLAILAVGVCASAEASVIRYTFMNTSFDDGGTVTGYFDWDTSLSPSASAVYPGNSAHYAISVSGGDEATFPPFTYQYSVEGLMTTGGTLGIASVEYAILSAGNLFGPSGRTLGFIPDVTVGIPGVGLNIPLYISHDNSVEILGPSLPLKTRQMAPGGYLVGEVIPEPGSGALLALAATGIAASRRRRSA